MFFSLHFYHLLVPAGCPFKNIIQVYFPRAATYILVLLLQNTLDF